MAVDLKSDNDRLVNTDDSRYTMLASYEAMKAIDKAIKDQLKNMDHIKSVTVEDDKVIKEEFHGDLRELSPDTEEEQYEALMNTFLNRKDRRKLSRYKGFKTFSDRFK